MPERILLIGLALACVQPVIAQTVSVRDVQRFDFTLANAAEVPFPPDGFSGIAHLAGDEYLAVSDANAYLHRLVIKLDSSTGEFVAVSSRPGLQLRNAAGRPLLDGEYKDREDLALLSDTNSVLIANELCGPDRPGPCLDLHDLKTGRLLRRIGPHNAGQLEVFRQAEGNWGFEAVAAISKTNDFWVATERALPIDGEPATIHSGSPVRLQKLNSDFEGAGQYVYVTDKIARPIQSPAAFTRFSGSRVVGLLVLPNGALVALENTFQGNTDGGPEARIRLYEIDFTRATDVSGPEFSAGLKGKAFDPVTKHLLLELHFDGADSNYEGIALGPRLDNGDYSALLIRDNGRGVEQTLHTLRIQVK